MTTHEQPLTTQLPENEVQASLDIIDTVHDAPALPDDVKEWFSDIKAEEGPITSEELSELEERLAKHLNLNRGSAQTETSVPAGNENSTRPKKIPGQIGSVATRTVLNLGGDTAADSHDTPEPVQARRRTPSKSRKSADAVRAAKAVNAQPIVKKTNGTLELRGNDQRKTDEAVEPKRRPMPGNDTAQTPKPYNKPRPYVRTPDTAAASPIQDEALWNRFPQDVKDFWVSDDIKPWEKLRIRKFYTEIDQPVRPADEPIAPEELQPGAVAPRRNRLRRAYDRTGANILTLGSMRDGEKLSKKGKIMAGAIGAVALTGVVALAYLKSQGHVTGGIGTSVEPLKPKVAPEHKEHIVHKTLKAGHTIWGNLRTYAHNHGVNVSDKVLHRETARVLHENGKSWQDGRTMATGAHYDVNQNILDDMLRHGTKVK